MPRALIYLTALLIAILILFISSGKAYPFDPQRLRPNLMFTLSSVHVNSSYDFNETNPGFALGLVYPLGDGRTEIGGEVGHYRNSFRDKSNYAQVAITRELLRPAPDLSVRAGAVIGLASYRRAEAIFGGSGIPTTGNCVWFAGAVVALRLQDSYEFRSRIMPGGGPADGLVTFEFGFLF